MYVFYLRWLFRHCVKWFIFESRWNGYLYAMTSSLINSPSLPHMHTSCTQVSPVSSFTTVAGTANIGALLATVFCLLSEKGILHVVGVAPPSPLVFYCYLTSKQHSTMCSCLLLFRSPPVVLQCIFCLLKHPRKYLFCLSSATRPLCFSVCHLFRLLFCWSSLCVIVVSAIHFSGVVFFLGIAPSTCATNVDV